MLLEWGAYKHFPYERELAIREAKALLGVEVDVSLTGEVSAPSESLNTARKLTYFAQAKVGTDTKSTFQNDLERSATSASRRQSTRYSVHGLHEYRGKFNPQVCGALINILGVGRGQKLLDPFCGSGTTLVEAAHRGIEAFGTDLNPLAVFIANAKLRALRTKPETLERALAEILTSLDAEKAVWASDARRTYLESWFEPAPLEQIERLRVCIERQPSNLRQFFFVVASNQLREFSLQNPADLRIRRRPSANISEPFATAFARASQEAIRKLRAAQAFVVKTNAGPIAHLLDNHRLSDNFPTSAFDAAITSPPYATALPYIDTQRLSLVWLGLLEPADIGKVEAKLIGSREMTTKEKRDASGALKANLANLPANEADFCNELLRALSPDDGFRRQAVPVLLYRYFQSMSETFNSVRKCFRSGGRFALIVGHNHTLLGGRRFDIDTPKHLASLANHQGWRIEEITALQPYQRYGLHAANAVKAETLVILEADASPLR